MIRDVESDATGLNIFDILKNSTPIRNALLELDATQQYHRYSRTPPSPPHVPLVVNNVTLLEMTQCVDPDTRRLDRIAALGHDIGIPYGIEGHEQRGAEFMDTHLQSLGVPRKARDHISETIIATKRISDGSRYVACPNTQSGKNLCDANQSANGLPFKNYLAIIQALRQEQGVTDERQWFFDEIEYLRNLTWHTDTAKLLWDFQRQGNIAKLLEEIEMFDRTERIKKLLP